MVKQRTSTPALRLLAVAGFLGALAACGPLPEPTEEARGIFEGFPAGLAASVSVIAVALGILLAAVALDRFVRTRRQLAVAPPASESEEEEEPVVAGIGQGAGAVPRWLYAFYVVIPLFAVAYIVNAVTLEVPADDVVPTPPPRVTDHVVVEAENIQFDTDEIVLPANTEVTIEFHNLDSVPHDIVIFTDETMAEVIFDGEIVTADTIEYTFESPDPGQYYFHCSVHPPMNGVVNVVEAEPDEDLTAIAIEAENIQFDTDHFVLAADSQVTIELINHDSVPHDVVIFTDETMAEVIFDGETVSAGTIEYTFESPDPGEYYFHCSVHPAMEGIAEFR